MAKENNDLYGVNVRINGIYPNSLTYIPFYSNASPYGEIMRVDNGGSLLIGTTTPNGYKLQVNGSGYFSGSLAITNLSNTSQPNFVAYNTSTGELTYTSTSSFTAATASFVTASNIYGPFGSNSILSASYSVSSSNAQTASYVVTAQTASYVLNAVSASYAITSSFSNNFKATNLSLGTNPINVTTGYGNYISTVMYLIATEVSSFWIKIISIDSFPQRIKLFIQGGMQESHLWKSLCCENLHTYRPGHIRNCSPN